MRSARCGLQQKSKALTSAMHSAREQPCDTPIGGMHGGRFRSGDGDLLEQTLSSLGDPSWPGVSAA